MWRQSKYIEMGKHERRLLSLPPDWWEAFDRAAKAAGETLSGWLGKAGKRRLTTEERKGLSEPNRPGKPRKK